MAQKPAYYTRCLVDINLSNSFNIYCALKVWKHGIDFAQVVYLKPAAAPLFRDNSAYTIETVMLSMDYFVVNIMRKNHLNILYLFDTLELH